MPRDSRKHNPQFTLHKPPKSTKNSSNAPSANRTYSQMTASSTGDLVVKNARVQVPIHTSETSLPQATDVGEDQVQRIEDQLSAVIFAPGSTASNSETEPPVDPAYLDHIKSSSTLKRRVREPGDESLRDFVPVIDTYLAEVIGLDSKGPWATEYCTECNEMLGAYQCLECHGRQMLCQVCVVKIHKRQYLHRIQKWNGHFFAKISLKELGLRIQLGHPLDDICLSPETCPNDDFFIIHSNGLHEVGLDYCGCGKGDQLHITQLLRGRLFPATVVAPKTAATIDVLDLYDFMSYESKVSAFEFYYALERLTDNVGIQPPRDRYPSFIRMAHEWRHLMMLKRAGRGHDPTGAKGTQEGECAVLCPACPQPDINMPPNWKLRPEHLRFLDALFLALDACFRLKRRNISSHTADPGLSHGFSYFVEETKLTDHLSNYENEVELKSTCSRHEAVNLSESKRGQGHASTGVAAVVCSRHDMKRPNGVAQLQRGERYCNMDYIFYLTTALKEVYNIVVSYDIVCQWHKNLMQRLTVINPMCYLLDEKVKFRFLVPKFHLPAHIEKCRTNYSFNFTKNVGRTDGEAPERGWAPANKLAPSTREMGPGQCRDTLDSHFGDENHKKVIGLGHSLLKKMMDAATHMAEYRIAHQQLESTLIDHPDVLKEWTEEIEAWENDPSKSNPFEREVKGPSRASVERQLAEDERRQLEEGRDFSLDETVTPSVLISTGISLEAEQRLYATLDSKIWAHSLDRQRSQLLYRGNTLIRKIEAWSKYQLLYIPGVAKLRAMAEKNHDPLAEIKAHNIALWLPSQIRSTVPVSTNLYQIEFDLRIPQAYEALEDLRAQLQIRAHVYKFKERFVRGQRANTRARNALNTINGRVQAAAAEYRAARLALSGLGPIVGQTEWQRDLRELLPGDIRDISEGLETDTLGTTHISWIWTVQGLSCADKATPSHLRDSVRLEWAKSRARANRFSEEVSLLSEEMMRVLRFFAWKSKDWMSKAKGKEGFTPSSLMHAEGVSAYAMRQAQMYKDLSTHFQSLWAGVPAHVARMQAIIQDPCLAEPGEFDSIYPSEKPTQSR